MDTTSKHQPKTGHKHVGSTREQRGLALFRAGAVSEHGDLFVVRSASRNYTVSVVDGEPRCDCLDFKARRATCKHGYSVVVHEAKKRCRRTGRPADRPQRRHGERREDTREQQDERRRGTAPARRRGVSVGLNSARVRANVSRMAE